MSKSSHDDKNRELIRALEKTRDYLEFSAAKSEFLDNEYYLAVRNYLEQVLKDINGCGHG